MIQATIPVSDRYMLYGVASVGRIDKIIGLFIKETIFCKRDL